MVRLRGEITARTGKQAGRRLTAALATGPPALEIDLARVTLLTRDGTQVLFDALRTAHSHGIPVIVSHARPQARATLRTLGLDGVLRYGEAD
ncbi:STAS domain-containing protein [Streptomyces erythrochromogenes]|uniref:STAS domain-containing protein n=1 Tax=Streptomyces erythrochromogenes TaxID=285574 RepID=UPI0036299D24